MHAYVHGSIIYNRQDTEAIQMPIVDEWIKKMWYIYSREHYSAIKKNEILPFVKTWIDLEGIMLNELSQGKTNIV